MRMLARMGLSLALGAGFATAAVAGQASADPAPAGKSCFLARDVDNFVAVDDSTVNLRVGVRDVYQLKLFAPCPDIDWAQRLGLRAGVSDWICEGANLDAEIYSPSPIGRQRCPVTSVRKLTPAEVAALPKKARP